MKVSKQTKALLKAMPTINSIKRQAKREAFTGRIIELSRGMDLFEKLRLIFKIL